MSRQGTVIQATLRSQDLIAAFWRELDDIAPATAKARREGVWAEEIEAALAGKEPGYWEGDAVDCLIDDLNANAPAGLYFGTLPGDAADFGWWPESWVEEGL